MWNVFLCKLFFSVSEKCLRDGHILWRRPKANFQRRWIDLLIERGTERESKKKIITPAISTCVQLSAHGPRCTSICTAGTQPFERRVESSVVAICHLISKLRWCTRCSRSRRTDRYTWRRSDGGKKNPLDKGCKRIEDEVVDVTTTVWSSCGRRLREGRLHGL